MPALIAFLGRFAFWLAEALLGTTLWAAIRATILSSGISGLIMRLMYVAGIAAIKWIMLAAVPIMLYYLALRYNRDIFHYLIGQLQEYGINLQVNMIVNGLAMYFLEKIRINEILAMLQAVFSFLLVRRMTTGIKGPSL